MAVILTQLPIGIVFLVISVVTLPVIPPVRFSILPSISIRPTEDNSLFHEFVSIDFVSITDEEVAPLQDSTCNSDRLRAVLEQSIAESTSISLLSILPRINDGQFAANCTIDSLPELDRRVHFCQLTRGRTTCAVATGPLLNDDLSTTILNKAQIFRPSNEKTLERPVREAAELPDLIASLVSHPPLKRRSEGHI